MLLKLKREGVSLSLEQILSQTRVDWDMFLERLEMLAHRLQINDSGTDETIYEIRPDILYSALERQSPAIPCHVLSKFLQLSNGDEDPSVCFMSAVWNDDLSYEACLQIIANRMNMCFCDPEDLRTSFYFALEDTFGKNGDTCNLTFARALVEIHPFILFSTTNKSTLPLVQLTSPTVSVKPWNKKTVFVLKIILEKAIVLKRNKNDVDFILGGLLTEIDGITPLHRICEDDWIRFYKFLKEYARQILEDSDFKRLVSRIILSAAMDRDLEILIELIETCPSTLMPIPLEGYLSPFSDYCEMCLERDGSCPDASVVQIFITQGRQRNLFTATEHGGLLPKYDGSEVHHFTPFDTLSSIFYLKDSWDFLDVIVKEVGLLCVIQRCIFSAWNAEHAVIWDELAFRYKHLLDRFTIDDFNSMLHFLASANVNDGNQCHILYKALFQKYRGRKPVEEMCQSGRYLLHEAIRGCRRLPHVNVDLIKKIANGNHSVLGKTDPLTGLPPFLLASSIDRKSTYTIEVVYELLRVDPTQCQSTHN